MGRRDKGQSQLPEGMVTIVALAQGTYYCVTGIWPLLSIDTFQRATGPKTDLWLVKTVGLLIAVIGAVVGVAGWRRQMTPELVFLATGSAAALAGIDVTYVSRRHIAPIYLLDALAEVALLGAWVAAWQRMGLSARTAI